MADPEYSKITLIIENSKGRQTFFAEKAEILNQRSRALYPELQRGLADLGVFLPQPPIHIDLDFTLRTSRNPETGAHYTIKNEEKTGLDNA